MAKQPRYWVGTVDKGDDFGRPIHDEFIDAAIHNGKWVIMNPDSWERYGVGRLGTGYGQRYKKQSDGRWLKVEG